jgi:hypothetical protein
VLAQLRDRRHPEELRRGPELPGHQVEGPVHAGLAADHQPVQVGAPEYGRVGPERERDRHVRPVPDARVDQHGEGRPDGRADRRDQVHRGHRPVELPPAVVGQLYPVQPELHRAPRVGRPDRPLEQQLPRPAGAQRLDVGPIQVGIEEVGRLPNRRRRPPGEVGVVERRPRQQLVPVGRPGCHRGDRRQRQLRRDRKPVAQVPYPIARHDRVHRDHQRRVPRSGGPVHQVVRLHPVPGQVELEPQLGGRPDAAPQLLDPGRRHRRQRVRQPVPRGRPRPADLPVRVQHPRVPGRPEHDRHRQRRRENQTRRVRRRHPGQHPGQEPPGAEGGHVRRDRDLLVGRPVDVVEHRPRNPSLGRPPQVGDVVTRPEPPRPSVQRHRPQPDEPPHLPHPHDRDDTPRPPLCEVRPTPTHPPGKLCRLPDQPRFMYINSI